MRGATVADCDGLIGLNETEVSERLGPPLTRRTVGGDLWLVFHPPGVTIRARCRADAAPLPRVASWTASFEAGYETLAEAAGAVGLWPTVAPDEPVAEFSLPLIRRPLPVHDGTCSFTATVRGGRITQVSVFDESPDWL